MISIRFHYLYRDGANFKSWGEVIFLNSERLQIKVIESKLLDAFLPDGQFIASQIYISEVFLFLATKPATYDHCFHEFYSVENCQEYPTDILNRSILLFLKDVEKISKQGWKAFDILDRF